MVRHTPSIILALKADRLAGMTIPELMHTYQMPKTTIWHHIRALKLSKEAQSLIFSQRGGSKKRSQRSWEKAHEHANRILETQDISKAWPLLYAALYWSEGTKSSFVFTNTDSKMIQVFLTIIRQHLGIKNEELDFMIRTCVPMDPEKCREHWSKIAEVPISQVRINHNDKHNKSQTQYGMCRITLRRGAYQLKLVHCLFRGIADKMLESSCSSTDRTSHS
jgi:hypothetical protein